MDGSNQRIGRRRFIQEGGCWTAGVAVGAFMLDLAACSADIEEQAASANPQPTSVGGQGGASAPDAPVANGGAPSAPPLPNGSGENGVAAAGAPGTAGQGRAPSTPEQSGSGGAGSIPPVGEPRPNPAPSAIASGAVLLGLYPGGGMAALAGAVQKLDFSWLSPGESVLIKVATNSRTPHPRVTSPNGVRAMVAELKRRGAGRVLVADQCGVGEVRLSAAGRYGSSRTAWSMNGMLAVEPDAQAYFFDEQPFDTGYFAATLPKAHHWSRGAYVPTVIRDIDHILYMPRIANHAVAGATIGQKSAVGWLRDDSRHDLHNDAQYYYEKFTEVNYAEEIHSRFRMVVTVSEAILLHDGPDNGTVYNLDPAVVIASTSLVNHDALATSLLVALDNTVRSTGSRYNRATASSANRQFASGFGVPTGAAGRWTSGAPQTSFTAHAFEDGITHDRALMRGFELSGGKPERIRIACDGAALDATLLSRITAHGEGTYDVA